MKAKVVRCKLVFDRKKVAESKGEAPIEFYFLFASGKKSYLNSRISVESHHWDNYRREIKDTHPNHIKLNNYLQKFMNDIKDYDLELIQKGKQLTRESLIHFVDYGRSENFLDFAREHIDKKNLAPSSASSQKRSVAAVEKFQSFVPFDAIDEDFVLNLTKYMKKELKYSPGTIWRVHKDMKTYISAAIRKGFINYIDNPYLEIKNTKPKGKHEFLDYDDLKALHEVKLPEGDLEHCRNIFLFGCYTGLRISDLRVINGKNFNFREGRWSMTLKRMVKVDKRIHQKLDEYFGGKAQEIILPYIEKYKDEKHIWGFKIKDSKQNEMLKYIQKEAKISTTLYQHLSRHTFGTLLAKETDGDLVKVMNLMGISKWETAKIYINLSAEL